MKVIIMVKKNYISSFGLLSLIFTMLFILSCEELFNFAKEQNTNQREASEIEGISSTNEGNGKTSGVVSASGNKWQQLQASNDTSIQGANVSFQPGTFTLDTEVSIEPGADLVSGDNKLPEELGLDDVAVEKSAPSVIVQGDEPPLAPFSISIPIPDEGAGLNLVSDFSTLIVLYRIVDINGKIKTGILARDKLDVKNKLVGFKFGFYGVFQAIFTSIVIEKPIAETDSRENIKNATGEAVAVDEAIVKEEVKEEVEEVVEEIVEENSTTDNTNETDTNTNNTNDNSTVSNPPPPSDTTPPGAPIVATVGALTSDATPTWTWTSGGGGNGTFKYKLNSNDLSSGSTETTANTFTPLTPLVDGSHTLYVSERDEAGNWSAVGSATTTIDSTAPTVTLTKASATQITVVFSEAVTGLTVGDFVVVNATADSLAGSGASYTLNITPSTGTVTIDLPAAAAVDAANNQSAAATSQVSFVYDNVPPTLALTISEGDPNNASFVVVTATFSEVVTGFDLTDISVTNGSASNFSGSGASYTFKVAPGSTGQVNIDVEASACVDSSGNGNASASLVYDYDGTPPDPPIVTSVPTITNDTTPTWNWTGGGGGSGNFKYKLDSSDLSTGATETAAFAYTAAPLSDGIHTLYVSERDALGNWSTLGSASVTIDTAPPTVTLSKVSSTQISVVFNEAVTGLAIGDFVVANATADSLAGSGASYTLNITPSTGTVTIDLPATAAVDAANNTNIAASQLSFVYDGISPSLTLSSSDGDPNNKPFVLITATFDEAVTGFDISDVSVTNGSANTFNGSGNAYTFKVVPATDGSVIVNIAAGVCADASGNTNNAASLSYVYDGNAPSAPIVTSGAAFSGTSTPTWTLTTGGGGNGNYRYKLNNPDLSVGSTLTSETSLTLGPFGNSVQVLYVQEKDAAGNWSESGSYQVTVDLVPPSIPTGYDDGISTNTETSTPMISWTAASDGGSGVDFYEIKLASDPAMTAEITTTNIGNVTSYIISGLSPLDWGSTYYTSIRACDKAGNCSGYSAASDGFTVVDANPPTPPSQLDDGQNTHDLNMAPRFVFNDTSADDETGMSHYEYAIGTAPGSTDVVGWTNIGLNSNFQPTGLSLINNTTYYTSIRAVDNQGNFSSQLDGDGWVANLGTKISASYVATCVRRNNGKVKCWGYNYLNMFAAGDGNNDLYIGDAANEMGSFLAYSDLDDGTDEAIAADTGNNHACFLLRDNKVKCWGSGAEGVLGSDSTATISGQSAADTGNNQPFISLNPSIIPVDIVASFTSNCILDQYGIPYCWGTNSFGQLGINNTNHIGDTPGEMAALAPVALPAGETLVQIAAGLFHFCGVTKSRNVLCWGKNDRGQLGTGDTDARGDATTSLGNDYVNLESPVKRVATGRIHSCAILNNGDVKCWGSNTYGECGIGNTVDVSGAASMAAVSLGAPAIDIGLGDRFSCALLNDNTVKCWGYNFHGQLGQGSTDSKGDQGGEMGVYLPPISLGTGASVKHMSVGDAHVCVLLADGIIKCWGQNGSYGKLGLEDTTDRGAIGSQMGDNLPAVDLGP